MSRATVQTISQPRQGRILRRLGMLAIAPILLFAACSSGGDNGGGSPPATNNNTPPSGTTANQFGYVIDAVDAQIRAFNVDGTNGNLSPVGVGISTGSFPHHVDVDPKGRYVYVANHGFNDSPFLSGFKITSASDASLVPISGGTGSFVTSDPATEANPHSSVMDQNGEFLYVIAGLGNSTLRAYKIDTTTGLPTLIQTPTPQSFPVGTHAHNITMSPNGQFVYTAGGPDDGSTGTGELHAFSRNTTDGTLTARNTIAGLTEATAVVVDPTSKFLYAASVNQVSVYSIGGDGTIAPIQAPNTFDTLSSPHSMTMSSDGKFLYVANIGLPNNVRVFQADADGRLAPIQTIPTGLSPNFVFIHPNGKILYTADTDADQLSMFTIAADGTLTVGAPIPKATVGDGPNGIGMTKKTQ